MKSAVKPKRITKTVALKVLEIVDQGLSNGLGNAKPGEMCVEAAVCFALGLPHGDDPKCVSPALRSLKIRLNDSHWSSKAARAKGLRRLAVAQLGSLGHLDDKVFAKRCAELAIRTSVPEAFRAAARIQKTPEDRDALLAAALRCEKEGTRDAALSAREVARGVRKHAAAAFAAAAYAAAAAAYAADAYAADAAASARDKSLAAFAEGVVQILIDMKAPGCKWLALTEVAK